MNININSNKGIKNSETMQTCSLPRCHALVYNFMMLWKKSEKRGKERERKKGKMYKKWKTREIGEKEGKKGNERKI